MEECLTEDEALHVYRYLKDNKTVQPLKTIKKQQKHDSLQTVRICRLRQTLYTIFEDDEEDSSEEEDSTDEEGYGQTDDSQTDSVDDTDTEDEWTDAQEEMFPCKEMSPYEETSPKWDKSPETGASPDQGTPQKPTDETTTEEMEQYQDAMEDPPNPYEDQNPYSSIIFTKEFDEIDNPFSLWSIISTNTEYPAQTEQADSFYIHNLNAKRSNAVHKKFAQDNSTQYQEEFNKNYVVDEEFTDRFEEVTNSVNTTLTHNDRKEVATTYLGTTNRTRNNGQFVTNPSFRVKPNSTVDFKLMDNSRGTLLLDTGATQSYMSKSFYDKNKVLHSLPRYRTQAKTIIVGNGDKVDILFAIPTLMKIGEHIFEIFTLVAEIQPTMDIILGVKNMFELEGVYELTNLKYSFKNRSIPMYPSQDITLQPEETREVEIEVPFAENITGHVITKWTYNNQVDTIRLKMTNNRAAVTIKNMSEDQMHFRRNTSIGIADIRSIGYYRINQETLQIKLGHSYHFEDLYKLVDEFNRIIDKNQETETLYRMAEPQATQSPLNTDKTTKSGETTKDQYPWLKKDDWRRHATDEVILDKLINLEKSYMTKAEKKYLMDMCKKKKIAFSLRDEIGDCPKIRVHINLHDKTPFFVRPFKVAEEDKNQMDWEMERLVHLGITTKKSTSHTSPVMLISRKFTADKRPVIDFRQLNSRIVKKNTTTPLLRDVLTTLGGAEVEVLSCIDFKDAYHSLRLDEESKEYCGIVPYFGAPCYRFERVPMGLSISPAMWMEYLTILLENIKNKENYIAIMDDLLLFGRAKNHMDLIENLLDTCIELGLKISPKKCQFFVKEMLYLGNLFQILKNRITVRPLKSRTEAIRNQKCPKTAKDIQRFCGAATYLSMFCPNLQNILKPLRQLTRKGAVFHWTDTHQRAFEEAKDKLSNPPILSLPQSQGRFTLYTDTSRSHAGSALWQMQDGTPRLIGYGSKMLPEAASRYSVTELEMKGMYTGMLIWQHFLGRREFDCVIDHMAAVYIVRGKDQPKTKRIERLLEKLQGFNFVVYYVKGKDLKIADWMSRAPIADEEDPRIVTPVSVTINDLLPHDNVITKDPPHKQKVFHNPQEWMKHREDEITTPTVFVEPPVKEEKLYVTTRSKKSNPPKVHGADKSLDPNLKPETQARRERHRSRQQHQQPQEAQEVAADPVPPPRPERSILKRRNTNVPLRPNNQEKITSPKSIDHRIDDTVTQDKELDLDGPEDPGQITARIDLPKTQHFIPPQELIEDVDLTKKVHKHLPKQVDIDKLLKQIEHKILRQTSLPVGIKDIKAHYLKSPHFRHLYKYLDSGQVPTNRKDAHHLHKDLRHYFLLDGLLFRIAQASTKTEAQLCIPTSMVDTILFWYHTSKVAGHMGIVKCIATIGKRFYIPELARHARAYIMSCHVCQMFKTQKHQKYQQAYRVNIDTEALTKFSMDIKHMPPGNSGYRYILVLYCEVSNYLIACPMKTTQAPEICQNIIKECIAYFGVPSHIICDQDPAFMSSLSQYMYEQLGIRIITVGPTNHKSLKAEAGIKSLSNILMKHLQGFGTEWPTYVKLAMLTHNTFHTPNLMGHSPSEIAFGRETRLIPELEVASKIKVSSNFKDHYEKLQKQTKYLREKLEKHRIQRMQKANQGKGPNTFSEGQIVYIYNPSGARLQTGSKKICCKFIGPLIIYKCLSETQYVVMSIDGKLYPYVIEATRMKAGKIQTAKGAVETLAELRGAISVNV